MPATSTPSPTRNERMWSPCPSSPTLDTIAVRMPSRARPVPTLPAKPPTARTNDVAPAREVRGSAGVRSTPTRPTTTASIIDDPVARRGSERSSELPDHRVPEGPADGPRLIGAIPHPEAERREVRIPDADPDADRSGQQLVRAGQHPGAVLAAGMI